MLSSRVIPRLSARSASFDKLFMGCDKRIIITTFASNVHRLQQIINVAAKYNRKVGITGRSMENVLHVASVLGYMDIPRTSWWTSTR